MRVFCSCIRAQTYVALLFVCLWTLGHFWAIGRKRLPTLSAGTFDIVATGPTKEVSFGVFIIGIVTRWTYLLLDRLHIHISIDGYIWISIQRLIQSPNAHAHSNPGSGALEHLTLLSVGSTEPLHNVVVSIETICPKEPFVHAVQHVGKRSVSTI